MNRRGFIASAASAALSSCSPWEARSVNYELRIALTARGVPVEGSSVVHLGYHTNWVPKIDSVGEYARFASGEAVTLDAPAAPIFGLLNHPALMPGFGVDDGFIVPFNAVLMALKSPTHYPKPSEMERAMYYLNGKGPIDVPKDKWPVLVKFHDLANPKSVVLAQADDPTISIRSVTIEFTMSSVTRHIRRYLPWLGELNTSLSGEDGYHRGALSRQLSRRNFEMFYFDLG